MTTISPIITTRQTILTALKSTGAVTAIVPAERIYPSKAPASPIYPLIRYGQPTADPVRLSGGDGGAVSSIVQCYVAKQRGVIDDPETTCGDLVKAIADALDALPGCFVTLTQLFDDPQEADTKRGVVSFTQTTI